MHAELVKQYERGKITAREFCEAVWGWDIRNDECLVSFPGMSGFRKLDECADFTLQRLEEIRKLDEDIRGSEPRMAQWQIETWRTYGSAPSESGTVSIVVKFYVRKMRTIARLQSIRIDLARGMKEER